MNIAWEEYDAMLKHDDMKHRSVPNVILWALGQIATELPTEFTVCSFTSNEQGTHQFHSTELMSCS